eukprot:520335-Hanusia_phi.AAC.1
MEMERSSPAREISPAKSGASPLEPQWQRETLYGVDQRAREQDPRSVLEVQDTPQSQDQLARKLSGQRKFFFWPPGHGDMT